MCEYYTNLECIAREGKVKFKRQVCLTDIRISIESESLNRMEEQNE